MWEEWESRNILLKQQTLTEKMTIMNVNFKKPNNIKISFNIGKQVHTDIF